MKMKKGLILVVVLLCVASMMAAMAYSTAYVQNPSKIVISSTGNALVAINPGEGIGNLDKTSYIKDGRLYFDFGKGIDGNMFGLQPGSGYTWNNLFSVTNNSVDNLSYRITMPAALAKHITITDNRNGQVVYTDGENVVYADLGSGETVSFKVHVWLHGITDLGEVSGSIQVNTYAK